MNNNLQINNVYFITVATKPHNVLNVLKQNIELKGDTLEVLGLKDKPYNIGQDIPGSRILGLKLQEVYKFINTKNDNDVIVFMDAFDVYYSGDKLTLLKRYKEMNKPIVFGAEPSCYPDGDKAQYYPKTNSYFRFLNSGLFIGRVKELKECMNNYSHEFIDEINDQLWWTNKFLERQDIIELDYNQHLFLNCVWLQDSELICNEGIVTFRDKTPLIIHGNGPSKNCIIPLLEYFRKTHMNDITITNWWE